MSVDMDGKMILGCKCNLTQINTVEDGLYNWVCKNKLEYASPWYDASPDDWIIGFLIKDVSVDEMNEEWMNDIREKSEQFEKLTGVKPKLMGVCNVW